MRTIKTMALLVLLVLTQYTLYAQKGKMKDKIETMKIGFITQKLNLTSEEAQKFWPVYNKFNDDLQKLRSTSKVKIMEDLSELTTMSDLDADKTLQEMINFKASEADLLKRYATEFKKVLPVKKVVMLFKAENDFKRELLKKLRERGKEDNN